MIKCKSPTARRHVDGLTPSPGRFRGLGPARPVAVARAGGVLLAFGLALSLSAGGCSSGDVTTSIYLEVVNGAGAQMPTQVSVDIYASTGSGVMGALLKSSLLNVVPSQTTVLGSLVIVTGARTGGVHFRAQGLVEGQAVSQADIDVTIAANKQVPATLTLAALGVHPDGGVDADAGADGPDGTDGANQDVPADVADDGTKDDGTDGDAVVVPDAAADRPTGDAGNGVHCSAHAECESGYCVDGVCCENACAGVCRSCAPSGLCTMAAVATDPRNECTDKGATMCKTDGVCDGLGACRMYAAGTTCPGTPGCIAGNAAVASTFACDGIGTCAPATQQDCKGFVCANGACATTCTSDVACTATAFCSSGTCVRRPSNLAGNGDLEYATPSGWAFFAGGALALSNTAAAGFAHAGQYSALVSGRTVFYQGPSYALPTGPGKYTISVWGMQNQDATLSGTVSIGLVCNSGMNFLVLGTFGTTMAMGNWTNFSGTIDTTTIPDCVATSTPPGVMKSVVLYLNQVQAVAATPVAFPDLFLDDLVVQVTDGHNLVGNPNFEAGAIDGWGVNGVATLAASTTVAKAGTHSLALTGRSASTVGQKYALPTGPAKYNVTFNALHTGTKAHSLSLVPTYTCLGAAPVIGTVIVTVADVAPNTWVPLTGAFTAPPPAAAAGCRLTDAAVYLQQEAGTCGTATGQIECPDLYVDEVSITIAP